MSLPLYCMLCSSSQRLISYFLLAVVGGLSFCLLWYVALSTTITAMSRMLGSNCFVNHSMNNHVHRALLEST